jgi:hypothetical protein
VEWLRGSGLVGQRTRIVSNSRDLQRGAFLQLRAGKNATLGLYAFNPDSGRALRHHFSGRSVLAAFSGLTLIAVKTARPLNA